MNRLSQMLCSRSARSQFWTVALAAVLLLVIVAVQYLYMRSILAKELERHAESELRMKAILIKGLLNSYESTVRDFEWDIQRNLHSPDSMGIIAYWLVKNHPDLAGAGMCFEPDYYPSKGRLFEPYAEIIDGELIVHQLAGPSHDYTLLPFYRKVVDERQPLWSDPYIDSIGDHSYLCAYTVPICDQENVVGVFGLDLSLRWLSDTLNARHTHPSSFDLLLTEAGGIIVQPDSSHVRSNDVQQVARLINDGSVRRDSSASGRISVMSFQSAYDGAKGFIYYANMRGQPHWKVAVVCYDREVFGPLRQVTNFIYLLMLLTLGMMGFILYRFMKNAQSLRQAEVEKERISSELRVASVIQQSMLPRSTDARERRADVDVYGMQRPAKEVGGDLFEYFVRDEKLYFCIGDVSGKGVPSALVMAVTQAIFIASSEHTSQPANIMQTINQTGCRNNDRNMFVTLFIGVLDLPTGRLRYCNAGHDTPVLMTGGVPQWLDVKPNLPLGVMDGFEYAAQECVLPPGATLLLYTDGVTEAMDARHQQFGRQRLLDVLAQCADTDSGQLVSSVVGAVDTFVQGAEQSDDLTMLAVRYTPSESTVVLDQSITLQNDVSQVPRLNAFVDAVSQRLQLDKSLQQQLKLAVEEAVVNVMQYAYPLGVTGDIDVNALCDGERLKFVISDRGKAFDPTKTARADTSSPVEERPIGGLGILLVRKIMDSINYERIGDRNLLTLLKKL